MNSTRIAYFFITLNLVVMVMSLVTGSVSLRDMEGLRVRYDRLVSDWYFFRGSIEFPQPDSEDESPLQHRLEAFRQLEAAFREIVQSEVFVTGARLSPELADGTAHIVGMWNRLRPVLLISTMDRPDTAPTATMNRADRFQDFEHALIEMRVPLDAFVRKQGRANEVLLWSLGATALLIVGVLLLVEIENQRNQRAAAVTERVARAAIAAQEQERARIARSLHDSLAQELSLVALELDLLDASRRGDAPRKPGPTDSVRNRLSKSVDWIRNLAHELRPAELDEMGLSDALAAYCEDRARESGVRIAWSSTGDAGRINRDIAINIYRIVQEAVSNAIHHAEAEMIRVSLNNTPDGLRLTVKDNGKGMNPSTKNPGQGSAGIGLITMQERASIVGSELQIRSHLGRGTAITLLVPKALLARG